MTIPGFSWKRVRWRMKISGYRGHGQLMPRPLAEAWVEWGNREHRDMEHWLA